MTDPYIGRVKVGRITRDFREQPMTEKKCPECGYPPAVVGHNPQCSRYPRPTASADIVERAFEMLCRRYVQRADARQRGMGLQYTEAETHDLAKTMAEFAALSASELTQGITDHPGRGGGCVEPPHSDVVKRVARALCEANFAKKGQEGEFGTVDDCWFAFVDDARAALTSLQTGEGWMRFLNAIMERTPNGEWIAVQYHPDGDWSVARQPLPPPPVEDDTP